MTAPRGQGPHPLRAPPHPVPPLPPAHEGERLGRQGPPAGVQLRGALPSSRRTPLLSNSYAMQTHGQCRAVEPACSQETPTYGHQGAVAQAPARLPVPPSQPLSASPEQGARPNLRIGATRVRRTEAVPLSLQPGQLGVVWREHGAHAWGSRLQPGSQGLRGRCYMSAKCGTATRGVCRPQAAWNSHTLRGQPHVGVPPACCVELAPVHTAGCSASHLQSRAQLPQGLPHTSHTRATSPKTPAPAGPGRWRAVPATSDTPGGHQCPGPRAMPTAS